MHSFRGGDWPRSYHPRLARAPGAGGLSNAPRRPALARRACHGPAGRVAKGHHATHLPGRLHTCVTHVVAVLVHRRRGLGAAHRMDRPVALAHPCPSWYERDRLWSLRWSGGCEREPAGEIVGCLGALSCPVSIMWRSLRPRRTIVVRGHSATTPANSRSDVRRIQLMLARSQVGLRVCTGTCSSALIPARGARGANATEIANAAREQRARAVPRWRLSATRLPRLLRRWPNRAHALGRVAFGPTDPRRRKELDDIGAAEYALPAATTLATAVARR